MAKTTKNPSRTPRGMVQVYEDTDEAINRLCAVNRRDPFHRYEVVAALVWWAERNGEKFRAIIREWSSDLGDDDDAGRIAPDVPAEQKRIRRSAER